MNVIKVFVCPVIYVAFTKWEVTSLDKNLHSLILVSTLLFLFFVQENEKKTKLKKVFNLFCSAKIVCCAYRSVGQDSFTMDSLYFMALIVLSYSSLFTFSFIFYFAPLSYSITALYEKKKQ